MNKKIIILIITLVIIMLPNKIKAYELETESGYEYSKTLPESGYTYHHTECNGTKVKEENVTYNEETKTFNINGITEQNNCKFYFNKNGEEIIRTYEVQVTVLNGTIEGETRKVVRSNENTTFSLNPTDGYGNPTVTCTNNQTGSVTNNTLTVSNVTNDTVCTVEFKEKISGIVSVIGTPKVGNTLTALVSDLNISENLEFKWYRVSSDGTEEIIEGPESYLYTVTSNDVGYRIICEVYSPELSKNISSDLTSVVTNEYSEINIKRYHIFGYDSFFVSKTSTETGRDDGFTGYYSDYYQILDINYVNNIILESNGISYHEALYEFFTSEMLTESIKELGVEGDVFVVDATLVGIKPEVEPEYNEDGKIELGINIPSMTLEWKNSGIVFVNYNIDNASWDVYYPDDINYEIFEITFSPNYLIVG